MKYLFFTFILFLALNAWSQDTFSIVAVDTVTGEIGSAGASCIDESAITGGAIIISDVLPGRGAIHTQSYWNATNQQNAHNRMVEGMSPQEIIDWLVDNDVASNPNVRQYGIVDFDSAGHARSAAFTGPNCMNYKNHITGPNYAIQGNILLGQQILDSMEARFLNTGGSFAEKLMAALQGANVIGADTRCTANGTSSLSAFIRIARPEDTTGNFYCDLNVPSVPEGMEPIDSLQTLFDAWLETTVGIGERNNDGHFVIYPNPAKEYFSVGQLAVGQLAAGSSGNQANQMLSKLVVTILNFLGEQVDKVIVSDPVTSPARIDISQLPPGIYLVRLSNGTTYSRTEKLIVW